MVLLPLAIAGIQGQSERPARQREHEGTAGSARADRIAQLKTQIADGSDKPDLEKVASSLVEFLLQGK